MARASIGKGGERNFTGTLAFGPVMVQWNLEESGGIDQAGTQERALLELLRLLKRSSYHFITPTPATHARVVGRPAADSHGCGLRDLLGWSLPVPEHHIDPAIVNLLRTANAIEMEGGMVRSRYRVSTLGQDLFLHSAFPTQAEDAVFFGPDSYRFADFILGELINSPPELGACLADIGAGAGVGAIVAANACTGLNCIMTDINPAALRLARINAAAAGARAEFALGADLDPVTGLFDLVLANPPYIVDSANRAYRDGGDMHGGRVAYEMAMAALDRLTPQGRLMLYTGSAIVDGEDRLRRALEELADQKACTLRYREIDPDVFGEELENPAYRDVERIAVVGAVIGRP